MKNGNWKIYTFWILISEAVGALAGWLTRSGIAAFHASIIQPPLSPPAWLFPLVWIILYALMGISAARVSMTENRNGLRLFAAQLTVNFFWTLLFFNARAYGLAVVLLALLWILVRLMILAFHSADPAAAWLQLPYLLWLAFALYLNIGVWILNR